MRIAVVGLGKVGPPLAAPFAHKRHEVVGVDINRETVASINAVGVTGRRAQVPRRKHGVRMVIDGRGVLAADRFAEGIVHHIGVGSIGPST